MPLTFHPDAGAILICDFSGFVPPEIVKKRPVVVVSPRRRSGPADALVTVVPLSSQEPHRLEPWHFEIPLGAYPPARGRMWIKGDILMTVGLARLDRVRFREGGRAVYRPLNMSAETMVHVRAAILAALKLA